MASAVASSFAVGLLRATRDAGVTAPAPDGALAPASCDAALYPARSTARQMSSAETEPSS